MISVFPDKRGSSPFLPLTDARIISEIRQSIDYQLRSGQGETGSWLERLVEGGERFKPNPFVLTEWMASIPGIRVSQGVASIEDKYLKFRFTGRKAEILFQSYSLMDTGKDLRDYQMELVDGCPPRARGRIKRALGELRFISFDKVPSRSHLLWTLALVVTAGPASS